MAGEVDQDGRGGASMMMIMNNASAKNWPRLCKLAIGCLLSLGGLVLLFTFPPSEYSFYPPCPSYSLFGIHCAGCGATRSLHALLHGNVAQALAYNPLFVLVLPFLLVLFVWLSFVWLCGKSPPIRDLPHWLIWFLVMLILVYTIARNVPGPPFDSLAPHRLG